MQSILYNTTAGGCGLAIVNYMIGQYQKSCYCIPVLPLGHLMGGADDDDEDGEDGEGETVSMETQFQMKNYLEK